MWYSDNPVADFERWDRDREKKLIHLPRCSCCDEPIQDDFCYEINGELICENCMETQHRRSTDDFIFEEDV